MRMSDLDVEIKEVCVVTQDLICVPVKLKRGDYKSNCAKPLSSYRGTIILN